MTGDKLFDACRIFKHACAFVDCAKFCETEPNKIGYRLQSHMVSGIVNSAFACEVFIKSLLVFNGVSVEKIHGHDLKILWGKLQKVDLQTALLVEMRMREWFNSEDETLFDKMLTEISNAFEYWRYIYEKRGGTINPNFLRGFRDVLREVCCNKLYNKSWEEFIKD